MQKGRRLGAGLWLGLAACGLTACGSGGKQAGGSGGGPGDPGASLTERLHVLSHDPDEQEVQVALDARITVTFDGSIVAECLQDGETFLRDERTDDEVPGSFALQGGGRTLTFTPQAPLAAATDYTFHLGPLLCDGAGRILEDEVTFAFRTLDVEPPRVQGCSIAPNASGVHRTAAQWLQFDEALSPASVTVQTVYLRDTFGTPHAVRLTLDGGRVVVQPVADLPGDRAFVLVALGGGGGVQDRAGNALASTWSVGFRTAPDTTPPALERVWPNTTTGAMSPLVRPVLTFSESMDPASIEPATVQLTDQYASLLAWDLVASADRKALRLVPRAPLVPGRTYTLTVQGGFAGPTDQSGNPLPALQTETFTTGADAEAPTVTATLPEADARDVSLNVQPVLTFAEPLDLGTVRPTTVVLACGERELPATLVQRQGGREFVVVPAAMLEPGAAHTLTIRGGADGVRDLAGNPLLQDFVVRFRTSTDAQLPDVLVSPRDNAIGVPRGADVTLVFDAPMAHATLHAANVRVLDALQTEVPGNLTVARGNRVVRFTPLEPWTPGATYTVVVAGGPDGVRRESGNWLADDVTSRFRAGSVTDVQPPVVSVTLNDAAELRKNGMAVPASGFTIDVAATDPVDFALDPSSFEVQLDGPGPAPSADSIFVAARVTAGKLSFSLPADLALQPGDWTLRATVRDLSGNAGTSAPLAFRVAPTSPEALPFERVQVVWVRFDLDRNGNGRPDFEDDLLALGLLSATDAAGSNARMLAVVRDGVLAQVNQLFGRSPEGRSLGAGSVPIRFTHRRPYGIAHMQIACGGLDPEGPAGRTYGAESTGVLGRAYFDYRNSQITDLDIATRPGLGVFPAELFLYQTKLHLQLYPSFVTTFARRFLPLAPDMGGTPAGEHALDAKVLAAAFAFESGTLAERARWLTVFEAADDWATAIGIVLAHEVGHAVGLTAPGPLPLGLHGDSSLHNDFSEGTDVMAAAVGYESLVALRYSFRDLNFAYLRQRLILR